MRPLIMFFTPCLLLIPLSFGQKTSIGLTQEEIEIELLTLPDEISNSMVSLEKEITKLKIVSEKLFSEVRRVDKVARISPEKLSGNDIARLKSLLALWVSYGSNAEESLLKMKGKVITVDMTDNQRLIMKVWCIATYNQIIEIISAPSDVKKILEGKNLRILKQ